MLKQGSKTISEFGKELEKMAAKVSAAHVAVGTFSTEFAAHSIVNPIIVRAFTQGLNEANTRFFLQARNPLTLCKAISDALECEPIAERSTALWYQTPRPSQRYTRRPQNSYCGVRHHWWCCAPGDVSEFTTFERHTVVILR